MPARDLFVKAGILKPQAPATNQKQETNDDTKPTPKSRKTSAKDDDTPTTPSTSSKEVYKTLDKALRKNTTDKFDYLKFRDTLHTMEKHVPDEEARFNAAGASAQAMKVSPDDLIDSAQDYLKVLDKQEAAFTSSLDDVQKENDQKELQLRDINKKLSDLQDQKESLEKEVAENKDSMTSGKASFEEACGQMSDEIKQDISKIKKYLKN